MTKPDFDAMTAGPQSRAREEIALRLFVARAAREADPDWDQAAQQAFRGADAFLAAAQRVSRQPPGCT